MTSDRRRAHLPDRLRKEMPMRRERFARLLAAVLGTMVLLGTGQFWGTDRTFGTECGGTNGRPGQEPVAGTVVVDVTGLSWQAGRRVTVDSTAAASTPDGQKAMLVSISGPPAPENRYAQEFSLVANNLQSQLPSTDPAAWVSKICVWLNVLKPASEPLIFVVRRGYGDYVRLEPAGWRQIELCHWGPQRLTIGELDSIAIRAALPPDGCQFLLGGLTVELTDEATEAAKWIPANSEAFTINGLWWRNENAGNFCRLPRASRDR